MSLPPSWSRDDATPGTTSDQQPRTKRPDQRVELKFVVTASIAEQLRDWARRHLDPDTHCDPLIGEGYRVSTLYLDTPRFEVYHREPPVGRRKYRLRRYGSEGTIWLETKRKSQGLVCKRRTAVSDLNLPLPEVPPDDKWHGEWFRRHVETRQLRPMSVVTYERFARIGSMPEGDVRLTIDRDLRGTSAAGWHVPRDSAGEIALLPDLFVVELKFRDVLPALFKRLLCELPLRPVSFSKYRTAVDGCGLLAARVAVAS